MALLYRKNATDRLSTPEQLDKMIVIIPLKTWLAAAAGAVVLLVFLVWGLFGSVSKTIRISGLFLEGGSYRHFYYQGETGTVVTCEIRSDSYIKAGDSVCFVRHEDGSQTEVTMEADGYLYDVFLTPGTVLMTGSEIAEYRCLDDDDQSYVHCFVSLEDSKLLREGMKIYAVPTYLDASEYGYITGEIESVSNRVMTANDMNKLTGNYTLTDSIMKGRILLEVRCRLTKDLESANGFDWTKREGEKLLLTDQTPIEAMAVIDTDSPIRYLWKE